MVEGREYRTVHLGERWQRSTFEYWNEQLQVWRTVVNWNTREQLFDVAAAKVTTTPELLPSAGR